MKSDTRNTTLYPKRLSAMSHGHFVADKHGMSFKFHTCLNPQSVYGVMLRLKQASWLDSFDHILCDTTEDMWEIRKRFPKVSARVHCIYDDEYELEDFDNGKVLAITSPTTRHYAYHEETDWVMLDAVLMMELDDLAPVLAVTSEYK